MQPVLALRLIVLLAMVSACSEPAPSEAVTKKPGGAGATGGESAELSIDPRSTTPAWLLERLQLPEPERSAAAAATNDPGAFERIIARFLQARPPLAGFPRKRVVNSADTIANYHAGVLKLDKNPPAPFTVAPRWNQEDLGAYYLNELHSLRFLSNFADEFVSTGRVEYFKVYDSVIADWLRHNPYAKPAHRRAWSEGTVSKRLMVLLYLMDKTRSVSVPRQVSLPVLLAMIHQHAEYLISDRTYRAKGNHGMRQDQALLCAAFVAPYFKRAGYWRKTALRRLRTLQIEPGFSKEGVWKEPSPMYHQYVMIMLESIFDLLDSYGMPEDVSYWREVQRESQHYLAHVLTPLGRFPPVGDSEELELVQELVQIPEVRYTVTLGKEGTPSSTLDALFPDAGDMVFRDTWTGTDGLSPSDAVYIHAHAAMHRGFGHRHADEMSFVFHGLGRWWILETGKYGYDRGAIRDHARSVQAHNGITFDHKGMRPLDMKDATKTVAFEPTLISAPELAAARATSTRFDVDNVKATRTFIFLRARKTLVLLDRVSSPQAGTWQTYFHLPPDARLKTERTAIRVTVPTHPSKSLQIVTERHPRPSIRIAAGQKSPMLGWYAPNFLTLVPAPVAVLERTGKEIATATLIRLTNLSTPLASAPVTQLIKGEHVISWSDDGDTLTLRVSTSRPLRVAFDDGRM